MHNPTKERVANAVKQFIYADLFEQVWGAGSLEDVELAYDQIAKSIAAFERTAQFAPFRSKYDQYLGPCLKANGKMDDCATGVGPKARKAAANSTICRPIRTSA
jgi:hypothetical protein